MSKENNERLKFMEYRLKEFKKQKDAWTQHKNLYTEKSIEFAYYDLFKAFLINEYSNKGLVRVEYNSPYSSDGMLQLILEEEDFSFLFEAKKQKDFQNSDDRTAVLCQVVHYLKRLSQESQLIPAAAILVSMNSLSIIDSKFLIKYLNRDYQWDKMANSAYKEDPALFSDIANDPSIIHHSYSLKDAEQTLSKCFSIFKQIIGTTYLKRQKINTYSFNGSAISSELKSDVSDFNEYTDDSYRFNINNQSFYSYNGKFWEKIKDDDLKSIIRIYLSRTQSNNSAFVSKSNLEQFFDLLKYNNTVNFDKDSEKINVKNGVLDLRTKKLSQSKKTDYFTDYIPISYYISSDLNMESVFKNLDSDTQEYMQIVIGEILIGNESNNSPILFIKQNSGSIFTFLELLAETTGSYSEKIESDVFYSNFKSTSLSTNSIDTNFLIIEERAKMAEYSSKSIKNLLNLESIYKKGRKDSLNNLTALFFCQELPTFSENDDYIWKNIKLITLPDEAKIESRVPQAKEMFLNWIVEGAYKYLNEKAEYKTPLSVDKSIEEWNASNDLVLAWFNENIQQTQNSFITMLDAFDSFNMWLISRGQSKVSMRYFGETFKNHSIFRKNKVVYRQKATIRKELNHSALVDEDGVLKNNLGQRPSIFENISFK